MPVPSTQSSTDKNGFNPAVCGLPNSAAGVHENHTVARVAAKVQLVGDPQPGRALVGQAVHQQQAAVLKRLQPVVAAQQRRPELGVQRPFLERVSSVRLAAETGQRISRQRPGQAVQPAGLQRQPGATGHTRLVQRGLAPDMLRVFGADSPCLRSIGLLRVGGAGSGGVQVGRSGVVCAVLLAARGGFGIGWQARCRTGRRG